MFWVLQLQKPAVFCKYGLKVHKMFVLETDSSSRSRSYSSILSVPIKIEGELTIGQNRVYTN